MSEEKGANTEVREQSLLEVARYFLRIAPTSMTYPHPSYIQARWALEQAIEREDARAR